MTVNTQPSEAAVVSSNPPNRLVHMVELGVFLFLIVPSMFLSFFVTRQGGVGFVMTAVMTILRDLALVSLILFFLWRNAESVTRIGWVFKNCRIDLLLGVALFVPVFFGTAWLDNALLSMGFSAPATPKPTFLEVRGLAEGALALVLVVVVAVAEETIFRGYLILRCTPLTASAPAAIVLSSVIFSLGHGYEGTAGVVTVGVMGAVLAVIYAWRKSLVAPIVIHFLQDFVSILVLPVITGR